MGVITVLVVFLGC